jgi:hypothetical protein
MRHLPQSPERPGLSSRHRLTLPALAMAALMASTGPLPVLAAQRQLTPPGSTWAWPGTPASGLDRGPLIANQDDDNEKKKKKKKDQQQKQQKQQKQQHNQNENQNKKSSTDSNGNKLNQKERDRIYQEGLEKGKDKGYKKGATAGYEEGFQKGKDKGKDKGYDRGYDRGWDDRKAKDKNRWKDWDSNRWRDYNRRDRNIWTRRTVVNNNFYSSPGWARGAGWYGNRPWGGGWYGGWSSPPWGWWVGQSVVWGVTALTTAAILNNAIDRAIERRQSVVVVPNTNWQLYYGTVQPIAQSGVTFAVNNGYGTYEMEADCEEGLLNGDVPTTASEAQLINAACQVTYGRGG